MPSSPDSTGSASGSPSRRGALALAASTFLLCTLLGLGAALGIYPRSGPTYESTAKLFVRYIVTLPADQEFPNPNDSAMLDAQVELLRSHGVALKVVDQIGPERIREGATREEAATAIREGLYADISKGDSGVIKLRFRHRDGALAVEALHSLIDKYGIATLEIHGPSKQYILAVEKIDQKRIELLTIEEELEQLREDPLSSQEEIKALEGRKTQQAEELQLLEQVAREEMKKKSSAKIPNISVIEMPTPARKVFVRPHWQLIALGASGPMVGLVLALMIVAPKRA